MRQLSLLLLLSVAMFCSTAMPLPPKSCFYHQDCAGTNQACSQSQCTDLCFSEDCNKGVNNARDVWGYTPLHMLHIYSVAVVKRLFILLQYTTMLMWPNSFLKTLPI